MRIVLTTFGSLGDLHPYIAIALELKHRGHTAVIAAGNLYRDNVESEGIEFAPVRPDIVDLGDPEEFMKKALHQRNGPAFMIRKVMMPHLRSSYEDLTEAVRGADFLVNHLLTFAGPLVAEKQGLPWASSVLAPMSLFSAYDPPTLPLAPGVSRLRGLGPRFHAPLFRLMKATTRSWTQPVRDLRRDLGLPTARFDPLYEGQYSPYLNLALFSTVVAKPQPDWPANTVASGFPFYDRPSGNSVMRPELEAFLADSEPPIVFTLGSSAVMDAGRFYDESISAAQHVGRRAILLIGSDPRNQPRARLPDGIVTCESAPFSELFPRAAAVVHQGGIGTTAQALRAGVPMLVVPFGFDQPDNAYRVERLGVAKVIARNRYEAGSASAALKELLTNEVYAKKAAEISQIIKCEDGAATACDCVERLLRGS